MSNLDSGSSRPPTAPHPDRASGLSHIITLLFIIIIIIIIIMNGVT